MTVSAKTLADAARLKAACGGMTLRELEAYEAAAGLVETDGHPTLAPDALHLALASFHKCDFLLTWNCAHIANANKFEHIRIINARLGLFVPALVTPIELCAEDKP